jgi:hypothetical protein
MILNKPVITPVREPKKIDQRKKLKRKDFGLFQGFRPVGEDDEPITPVEPEMTTKLTWTVMDRSGTVRIHPVFSQPSYPSITSHQPTPSSLQTI